MENLRLYFFDDWQLKTALVCQSPKIINSFRKIFNITRLKIIIQTIHL